MGLTDFGIILERPTKTYLSGRSYQKSTGEIKSPLSDVIKGQLVINLSSPINFQKIKIELVGSGTVKWTEERGTRSRNNYRIITYSNQETYVKKETVLHNGPSLPQGIHYLPFTFLLPPNMPSSFESEIGQALPFLSHCVWRMHQFWRFSEFCNKMFSVFPPWKLGQIGLQMTVLDSAHHEDSETPEHPLYA